MVATGHVAIVTGANHGIGAATAQALAARGCAVLCTFLRVHDAADPGTPPAYRDHRAQDAAAVIARSKHPLASGTSPGIGSRRDLGRTRRRASGGLSGAPQRTRAGDAPRLA